MTDYTSLLKRFPAISLPNENAPQPRDKNMVYLAQPCGKRAFAWFTYNKTKNVCFFLDIKDKTPVNIDPVHACFSSSLSLGTVLHGTVTNLQGVRTFVADNIFFLQGKEVEANYRTKLEIMAELFKTGIDNRSYMPSQAMFSLPVYSFNLITFDTIYKLYCVKGVHLETSKTVNYPDRTTVLTVKPTGTCDSYELFGNDETSVGLACVDTYKRSVLLNDIFGRLSENHNLDSIEESDDESEVEKEKENIKGVKMHCRWHPLHKQWVPLSVV